MQAAEGTTNCLSFGPGLYVIVIKVEGQQLHHHQPQDGGARSE